VTALTSTVFRKVKIGSKRYVLGLHPRQTEDLISLRPLGCHLSYVVTVSMVRIHAALAYGRAEQSAKREARRNGVSWKQARRAFLASLVPPRIPARKKAQVGK
jgi:hypothetical protein